MQQIQFVNMQEPAQINNLVTEEKKRKHLWQYSNRNTKEGEQARNCKEHIPTTVTMQNSRCKMD